MQLSRIAPRFHLHVCKTARLSARLPRAQYLGSRSPEPVKKKVLELIYSWTLGLPDEAKITDAYQMLKKQGEGQSGEITQLCSVQPRGWTAA